MLNNVLRSEIYKEFTPKEREYWFGITNKAVRHHVDTLYYNVSLKDDDVGESTANIHALIRELAFLKQCRRDNPKAPLNFFDLDVSSFGCSGGIYMYGLKCNENFDIFFADSLPNKSTPRVQVQLRTYSLIIDGLYNAIEKSFDKLKEILDAYDIEIYDVKENRIDYAFHNNLIQKPMSIFNDKSLDKHLKSSFHRYKSDNKIPHRADEHIEKDYLAIGSRKANFVFMRAYNKAKEVVQQRYKGFFFQRWLEEGIISKYDEFVYSEAYKLGSWVRGCLIGRLKWYITYGKNEERKEHFKYLLEHYNIKTCNCDKLKDELKGVLPPNTVVFNVEFETKRKFYSRVDKALDEYVYVQTSGDKRLYRLYKILDLRRVFLDFIMTKLVEFVDDRTDKNNFRTQDWWRRLRGCKIEEQPDDGILDLYYTYNRKLDANRQRAKILGDLALFQMLKSNSTEDSDFGSDIWDCITYLNDNDIKKLEKSNPNEKVHIENFIKNLHNHEGYKEARAKKRQQYGSVIRKNQENRNLTDVGYSVPKEALEGYGFDNEELYESLEASRRCERASEEPQQISIDNEYFYEENLLEENLLNEEEN